MAEGEGTNGRYPTWREFEDYRAESRGERDRLWEAVRELEREQHSLEEGFRAEIAAGIKAMQRQVESFTGEALSARRFRWANVWMTAGPILGGLVGSIVLKLLG